MTSKGQAPRDILFIKPGSMGDVIHALPCAAAIKNHWPEARLTWLIDDRWQPLLGGFSSLDAEVVFPRRKFRGVFGILKSLPWIAGLSRLSPDLVLDLQGLLRSALMARFSGGRRIVGLSDAREGATGFYHEIAPVGEPCHAVTRYLRSLPTLGVPIPEKTEFPLPSGIEPEGAPQQGFVLLHPYSRGAGKSLTPVQVTEFCHALPHRKIIIVGGGISPDPLPSNTISLLNRTSLDELIWLTRRADFVVSVDSGPMHIAAALTDRLLSIHTWSDPGLVGPYNPAAHIWKDGRILAQDFVVGRAGSHRTPTSEDMQTMAAWVDSQLG